MEQRELVSPELALVDYALAVRARADLPWRPWEAHVATEIYQTQTRAPRVHVPGHVRLGAGRYSWTVRPAIVADLGIRLAAPIVRRAFRVRGD